MKGFASQAPTLLFAVLLAAAFEQAYLSLFPPYGLAYALSEAEVATLLSVLIVGNVVIQVPLGLAAERWQPRLVLIVCAALTAVGCLLQPLLMGTPLVWPLAFCLGALSVRSLHGRARRTRRPLFRSDAGRREFGVCPDVGDWKHGRAARNRRADGISGIRACR